MRRGFESVLEFNGFDVQETVRHIYRPSDPRIVITITHFVAVGVTRK